MTFFKEYLVTVHFPFLLFLNCPLTGPVFSKNTFRTVLPDKSGVYVFLIKPVPCYVKCIGSLIILEWPYFQCPFFIIVNSTVLGHR